MRRPSFRLRIALLACLLAGGALVGFALLSSWLIRDAKLERLDARLENALMRSLRPRSDWSQLEAALERHLERSGNEEIALWIRAQNGETLYQSSNWPEELSASPRFRWDRPHRERPPRITPPHWHTQAPWRVGWLMTPRGQVGVAASLQSLQQEMAAIRNIYGITIPAMLLVIAAVAWGVAGQTLAPIRQLRATMAQVTAQGLDRRVPTGDTDVELVELITVFNQMLERLERSFHQASRFSGDAAHELKTPLAILQGELEQAIQQVETGSDMQQILGSLLSEVTHLSSIVRKLLLLSLADAGQMALQRSQVNLSELLEEQLEDVAWLNADLSVEAVIAPELWGRCDRSLIAQVLQNLIGNAVKYNQPSGWIRLQAQIRARQIQITLTNAARQIPADPERLFERFYRSDSARSGTEGLGLGLSLSREIARAHGGELRLAATTAAAVTFELTLPAAEPP